ncbi:MAG: MarR family transcriptional regulator [Pseudomonadota bacterium]
MDGHRDAAETGKRLRHCANPTMLLNHNERAVLSMLRDRGPTASAEIAKTLNVSAQTASVIVRALEDQGVITKLPPIKGRVGKP